MESKKQIWETTKWQLEIKKDSPWNKLQLLYANLGNHHIASIIKAPLISSCKKFRISVNVWGWNQVLDKNIVIFWKTNKTQTVWIIGG